MSTLAQLAIDEGMSYVIQLRDGSFIIIDGGTKTDNNENALWNYLDDNKIGERPVIACWMITHPDPDHIALANSFIVEYASKIQIESFAYTFPKSTDVRVSEQNGLAIHSENWATAMDCFPNATVYDLKAGDKLTFEDVVVDVLVDASVNTITPKTDIDVRNDRSAAWKMTFTQGTANVSDDKTFMVVGDCMDDTTASRTAARLTYLVNTYGDKLKSDVLQVAHHGVAGGSATFYNTVAPSISLFSSMEANINGENSTGTVWKNKDYNLALAETTIYYMDNIVVLNMSDLSVIS